MAGLAHIASVIPSVSDDWRSMLSTAEHNPPPRVLGGYVAPKLSAPWVPQRFANATLETFLPDPQFESQAAALDSVKSFCRRAHERQPAMLALIGTTGTGKTHLLYSAAKALYKAGHYVHARPWYRMADLLRYGGTDVDGREFESSERVRSSLQDQRIVMLDEVRKTAGTDFDDTELAKIVCHAWDNGHAMLITTNVSPLTEVVGPAVASRFTQITITGRDRRQSQ